MAKVNIAAAAARVVCCLFVSRVCNHDVGQLREDVSCVRFDRVLVEHIIAYFARVSCATRTKIVSTERAGLYFDRFTTAATMRTDHRAISKSSTRAAIAYFYIFHSASRVFSIDFKRQDRCVR